MTADFRQDFEYADNPENRARVEAIFQREWPGIAVERASKEDDLRHVDFWCDGLGKRLGVDVKVRRADYPDVLIEYVSKQETGAPGWSVIDGLTTHDLYLWPSSYWMVYHPLLVWAARRNEQEWRARYGINPTRNKGWTTEWLVVPDAEFMAALGLKRGRCRQTQ
jgi:hypothetical protein